MRTTPPLLAAATLLLAGCGGGGEVVAVQAGGSAATATVASSPTPTTLTKEQAAQRYLQVVGPYNAEMAKLNALGEKYGNQPVTAKVPASYRAQAAATSKAMRAFLRGVLDTPWPADVAPTAQRVVDEGAAGVTTFEALAVAKTWSDVQMAFAQDRGANTAAQRIRVQLGLPPAK